MRLFSSDEKYKLYHGSMLELSEVIEPKSIDSIVTDPPYELNFMGKGWDRSGIAFQKETWRNCYEVLKPGGYLLAFGGSRTFHRIAVAIEDRGFEIRDVIMWLYGSGFPKSMNVGLAIDKKNGVESQIIKEIKTHDFSTHKGSMMSFSNTEGQKTNSSSVQIKKAQNEWSGWGTALKPSYEPIIVARKPVEGSVVDNVLKYGVGGINIDGCRVKTQDELYRKPCENGSIYSQQEKKYTTGTISENYKLGRFPANTILTYDESNEQEVCENMPVEETGSASRYFYCAKASQKDRDDGLFEFSVKTSGQLTERKEGSDGITAFTGSRTPKRNNHPTVKPTELMQYLVRLVTPSGGTVLDPFNGSGSTGKAVMYENKEKGSKYKYIGIDLSDEYLAISKARIEYAEQDNVIQAIKDGDIFEQKSLFEGLDL